MTHPFDEIHRRLDVDRDVQNDLQLEASLVNRLLVRTYGPQAPRHRRSLEELSLARSGDARITFALFHEQFPDYPVLLVFSSLGGVKLHTDPSCYLPSILKEFWKTPFFTHYADMSETQAPRRDGLKVGLVFRRSGLKYGMVLHNGGLAFWDRRDTVVIHNGGSDQCPELLAVQTYDSMVDAIAARYRN